ETFRRTFAIVQECVRRLYRELPPAPQGAYARAIEERFGSRRHTALTLSPADFSLVARWWNRGGPLWIRLASREELCRRKDASGEPARVRRLSYVASDGEERFAADERSRTSAPAGPGAVDAAGGGDGAAGGTLLDEAAGLLVAAAAGARGGGLPDAASLFE